MICALILAAGRSQRMGANKLLLPFRGSTVLGRVVDAFLGARLGQVMVVVRPPVDDVRRALAERHVVLVENPNALGDMLSSLRCGLRALPAAVQTIAVSPADQPSLEPVIVRRMLQVFHELQVGRASPRPSRIALDPVPARREPHPGGFTSPRRDRQAKEAPPDPPGILVPVHAGRRGHPLILAARYRNELLTSFDGLGLRGLLQAHPADIVEWLCDDPAVVQDLDTPADYQAAAMSPPEQDP